MNETSHFAKNLYYSRNECQFQLEFHSRVKYRSKFMMSMIMIMMSRHFMIQVYMIMSGHFMIQVYMIVSG